MINSYKELYDAVNRFIHKHHIRTSFKPKGEIDRTFYKIKYDFNFIEILSTETDSFIRFENGNTHFKIIDNLVDLKCVSGTFATNDRLINYFDLYIIDRFSSFI